MWYIQCNNFSKVKTKVFVFKTLCIERVRYGKNNTVFSYRTVVYQKIPYVIPYRTFFRTYVPYSTVPYRTQVPAQKPQVHNFKSDKNNSWFKIICGLV